MTIRKPAAAWLLILPLTMMSGACVGDGADDRSALRQDELDRELDLALRGDSAPAAFGDSAVAVVEEAPMPEPGPAPRVQPPAVERPRREPAPAPPPVRPREPRQEAPTPAPAPRPRVASVSRGTSMSLTMNQTLSTETNRAGDAFTATLQGALTDESGAILIPAGATIRGRMTQVDKSGHVGETGIIKLAFESVSFGGSSYPLDATVVRANPERSNRTTVREQATKVAAGAAAGAVIGRVLGKNTSSTVKGAVIGAAAGTAIAMGTADVDVVLPAGSELVIRLDSPIQVRR